MTQATNFVAVTVTRAASSCLSSVLNSDKSFNWYSAGGPNLNFFCFFAATTHPLFKASQFFFVKMHHLLGLALGAVIMYAQGTPTQLKTYDCASLPPGVPCLLNPDGTSMKIRVKYIDELDVVTNPVAKSKVQSMGRTYSTSVTCDSADTAVPECFVFENWNGGWIGSFMHSVLKDLNVDILAVTTANTSTATKLAHPGVSSYMLCIWEVRSGEVDLCVGDFWETPDRRNLTGFTASLDPDTFSLYTMPSPNLQPKFQTTNLLGIFAPFDGAVWLLLMISILFFAFGLWIVEGSNDSKDYPFNIFGFLECVYQTTLAFVGGEHIANFLPSRIMKVGLGIVVFVYVNSYIASLASYFVVDNAVALGVVSTLQDVQVSGGRLCILQV